ncbi:cytochrome c [Telmatospirillum sp. J64-1]|uniref:c-type cytochrome n=1 Tax=Telmatospirillum sp. J64-1 TaxID=2502183 RepID=UPI00115CCE77|nr:cytochrome c [Telmatospirillum sp. J64-1]
MRTAFGLLGMALFLAGCDDMANQDRYRTYDPAPDLPGGRTWQMPVEGTVARGQLESPAPPEITPDLVAHGRDRYAVYCTPCHGADGGGNGHVAGRTMPHPPPFTAAEHAASLEEIVEVIERGVGVMYPMADRIGHADRWAIAAHVMELRNGGGAP